MSLRVLLVLACFAMPLAAEEPAKADGSYYKSVRPIFVQHCQGCHQPAKAQGGYVMIDVATMMKPGESDKPPIVAGKPEKSNLFELIQVHDGAAEMPKKRDPLSKIQIESIRKWIAPCARPTR